MANQVFLSKTTLIGGGATALDSIDGAGLVDGDFAIVTVAAVLYIYKLDADSAAAESSPLIIAPDTNGGDKRWLLQQSRSIAVGSDANGDTYYRASGVLARLAKGAADTKLFMNAGATAPEWVKGLKIKNATRDMTAAGAPTDVAYTGAGFKPSAAIILAAVAGTTMMSIGMTDGSIDRAIDDDTSAGTAANNWNLRNELIDLCETFNIVRQSAVFKTWDADGITLTWTKTGTPSANTAILIFLFFR